MIIKASHHRFLFPFFKHYALWKIRRSFAKVEHCGTFTDRGLSVLMLANHTTWWDGFWAMHLCKNLLNRLFFFMMLEEQLRKFWFFRYTGGFSVKKHSRSALESITYATELLQERNNMVLIFPEGKIQSMHKSDFTFERGIDRIIKLAGQDKIQILMVAFMVDYFSSSRPSLYIHYQEYISEDTSHSTLESAYTEFYRNCVSVQNSFAQ